MSSNTLGSKTGSGIPAGGRTGSGGLGGGSGGPPSGSRVGSGGLGGGSGGGPPSGNRIGSGGLGNKTGSGTPSGSRVGSGGLGSTTGSGPPSGTRVGSGGLNGRSSRNIPAGNRVGSGGLRSSGLTRTSSSGGGGGSDDNGLGNGGRPFGGGRSRGSSSTDQENFRHIVCGGPVASTCSISVSQQYHPDTGLVQPVQVARFSLVTDGTDWTPEKWEYCTDFDFSTTQSDLYYTHAGDSIGWYLFGADSPTVQIRQVPAREISNGCYVNFDAPFAGGRILSTTEEVRAITPGQASIGNITPTIPGATVFVEPFRLSFS